MSSLKFALVLAIPLAIVPSSQAATPADRTSSSGGALASLLSSLLSGSTEDESAILQKSLKATDEEWSIIYPKLEQITALRAAVYADGPGETVTRRLSNGPMGGTSMDAPTMAGRGGGRWNSRSSPFDPSIAPGARTSAGVGAALTRGLSRNWANSVKTGQGNSVQALLTELQALLDDRESTDKQLFDKLTAIRAARAKAARDLDAAQKDLIPLLTTDQHALLMILGYMD